MDRLPQTSVVVTDADTDSFFGWAARERAIARLLHTGKLGYGEFILRRQMNYDRLITETSRPVAHEDSPAD